MAETQERPAESRPREGARPGGPRPHREGGRPGGDKDRRRRFQVRRKVCRFCVDKTPFVDYKDMKMLRFFLTERGKILPRRISGNCARHQREVTTAVQRSRNIAMLPFTGEK